MFLFSRKAWDINLVEGLYPEVDLSEKEASFSLSVLSFSGEHNNVSLFRPWRCITNSQHRSLPYIFKDSLGNLDNDFTTSILKVNSDYLPFCLSLLCSILWDYIKWILNLEGNMPLYRCGGLFLFWRRVNVINRDLQYFWNKLIKYMGFIINRTSICWVY